jgi:hypothetical protein
MDDSQRDDEKTREPPRRRRPPPASVNVTGGRASGRMGDLPGDLRLPAAHLYTGGQSANIAVSRHCTRRTEQSMLARAHNGCTNEGI